MANISITVVLHSEVELEDCPDAITKQVETTANFFKTKFEPQRCLHEAVRLSFCKNWSMILKTTNEQITKESSDQDASWEVQCWCKSVYSKTVKPQTVSPGVLVEERFSTYDVLITVADFHQ